MKCFLVHQIALAECEMKDSPHSKGKNMEIQRHSRHSRNGMRIELGKVQSFNPLRPWTKGITCIRQISLNIKIIHQFILLQRLIKKKSPICVHPRRVCCDSTLENKAQQMEIMNATNKHIETKRNWDREWERQRVSIWYSFAIYFAFCDDIVAKLSFWNRSYAHCSFAVVACYGTGDGKFHFIFGYFGSMHVCLCVFFRHISVHRVFSAMMPY